jgi:site-specific recombinase XerD
VIPSPSPCSSYSSADHGGGKRRGEQNLASIRTPPAPAWNHLAVTIVRRQERQERSSLWSERGAPLSAPGFSRMVERAGRAAKLGIKVHGHVLRHACGYALANAGHDTRAFQAYLGHANIQNTTRYTALAQDRFAKFWHD